MRWIIWTGGAALLAAALTDTLAVIGRHVGLPLHGSIEIVQAAILLSGGLALFVATVEFSHARVRLLTDRLPAAFAQAMRRVAAAMGALCFALVLCGSVWIAADLWNGHEVSELLGIPYRVLRIVGNACLLLTVLAFLRRAVPRRGQ